jgi:hypothetical protein
MLDVRLNLSRTFNNVQEDLMLKEVSVKEALEIFGGDPSVGFPEGGWFIACGENGDTSYGRITPGSVFTEEGQVVSGGVTSVTETQYAYQLYRDGERETGPAFPVTVTVGC